MTEIEQRSGSPATESGYASQVCQPSRIRTGIAPPALLRR
jgi:hypothetical protein